MRVAIIPARGGSRRIPGKNIRPFYGKPIIAYSIKAAQDSGLFDGGIWVSTEDKGIAEIARNYGANVIQRPDHLAEIGAPDCGTQEVTRHALLNLPFNDRAQVKRACCIYPCAPLITPDDLLEADRLAYVDPYNYVYAVGQFYYGMALRFINEPRNFDYSKRMESARYIDINTEDDWSKAEQMYADLMFANSPNPRMPGDPNNESVN